MIDLATWTESERRGLLAEIDFDPTPIPAEFVAAAARYREEHGHFRHPGWNTETITLTGMAQELKWPTPGLTGMWEDPVVSEKILKRKIYAAKTVGGKTSILTRYFGHGISSGPAWVAV